MAALGLGGTTAGAGAGVGTVGAGTVLAPAAEAGVGAGTVLAPTAASTFGTVGGAGSGALASGGSGLFGQLASVGQSVLDGLQSIGQSLYGPPANFVGPPGGTPTQSFLGGLSSGATQGLFGSPAFGKAGYAGQGLGTLLQHQLMQGGQPAQAPPAQVYPRNQRYV